MAPRLFLTGGTGYVRGSVLHTLATAHPDYEITALLRSIPPTFTTTYPRINVVLGDYNSADLLATHAAAADIVVHSGDSDHEPSLTALLSGLRRPRPSPGYLIHLSGTGIVADWQDAEYLGKLNPRVWSDVSSLGGIQSLPWDALHRNTERNLHAEAAQGGGQVNVAIMCPPDIYGRGKGPGKTHSAFVPFFVQEARRVGRAFYYSNGANTRSWVHIDDLMRVYLRVVEAAVAGGSAAVDFFNCNGYYFAGTQEHSHLEVAKVVGRVLHQEGVIEDPEPVQVNLEQLDLMLKPIMPGLSRYLFASNSRTRAERAESLFGYRGEAPWLSESLPHDVLDCLR